MSFTEPPVVADVIPVPGLGGFFFDDQAAVIAGAVADGLIYAGAPVTAGYRRVRQASEAVSLLLVLDDGSVAVGDCVSVQYSGVGGREPILDGALLAHAIREHVSPGLIGQSVRSFRDLAGSLDELTHGVDQLGRAAAYGLSQAVLDAVALGQGRTMTEVLRGEWGLTAPIVPVPVYAQSGDARRLNVDKMILKGVDALPHGLINSVELVGQDGRRLVEYVAWVRNRILELRDRTDYEPTLHFDVYGTLGVLFGHEPSRLGAFLAELEAAAAPFRLRVEHPLDAGSRDGQIEALAELRRSLRSRGINVELVADEWANTLEDMRAFCEGEAADMLHIKTPDLGGIQHSVEAVLECQAWGVAAHIGGSCTETDRAAQASVHLALATGADQMLAKPGMGVDEGLSVVVNEMRRTIAVIEARQANAR